LFYFHFLPELHGEVYFSFPHISVHWRPFAVNQISAAKNLSFKNAFYSAIEPDSILPVDKITIGVGTIDN